MLTSFCPISKHSYHKIIQIIIIKYSVFICTESENCLGWNRPLEIIRLSYPGSSRLPLDLQVLGTTTDGLHYLSRQPTVVFDHPHITKYFLVFRLNSTLFSVCTLPFVLSVGTAEKSLAPRSSFAPIRNMDKIPHEPSSIYIT